MTLCANRPRPCPNIFSDFKCHNQKCVNREKICDLHDDCGDRSDERGCHEEGTCSQDIDGQRGGCQHRCNNLPDGGYLCLCDRGWVVDAEDPKKCLDVDECSTFTHNCSHMCSNLNGTYACSCREGFELTDQFSGVCRAKEHEPKLLYSTGPEVLMEGLHMKRSLDVIKNEARIESMDYDPLTMMLFWVDSEEQTLKRSFIPGTDEQPEVKIGFGQDLLTSENTQPKSVAYDWIGRNIYWLEVDPADESGNIYVAKSDGRYKRALLPSAIDNPTSLAVNPKLGLMFWTSAGRQPKIETAWMDGSKRRAIVTSGVLRPEAIAIDYSMGDKIYWADSKLNTIEMMDLDGQNRHVVLQGERTVNRPVSLDVFESDLFWVNHGAGDVMRQDKFGRGVPVIISKNLANPKAVKLLHPMKYNESISNPCQDSYNGCSHLCLLIPDGRSRCKCPTGQRFSNGDQTVCDAGKTSFLFSSYVHPLFQSNLHFLDPF